jgi:hypothetical protein
VTTTADAGAGSLRAVLAAANNGDVITFNIPGNGVQEIDLLSALPPITVSVTIDATTQPNYNGTPLIRLDGNAGNFGDALNFTAANSTVRGMCITRFAGGAGVLLSSANGGCTVSQCYLGVTPNVNQAAANAYGVRTINSPNNLITGNVISGNNTYGVWIMLPFSTGNVVLNNNIGTNAAGTAEVPNGDPNNANSGDGVELSAGANGNLIGGDYFTQGNLISGNRRDGVHVDFDCFDNIVDGNIIGLTSAGNQPLGNLEDGIRIESAANDNTVGGGTLMVDGQYYSFGNVISANAGNGVRIDHDPDYAGPTGNKILGNYIGLATDGVTIQGNGNDGVKITDAPNNWIGSGNATEGNVISGNTKNGVEVTATSGTKIYGNYIGTDKFGTSDKGNLQDGVNLGASTSLTSVGQPGANSRNVISGNAQIGLHIYGSQNTVANNYIGLGADGTTVVGNLQDGIVLQGDGATGNLIGGTTYDAGNVISGNRGVDDSGRYGDGIALWSGSSDNTIMANLIGTDASGVAEKHNNGDGIFIELNSTGNNIIGFEGLYNFISGNSKYGVEVDGSNNLIDYNMIGYNVQLDALIDDAGWAKDSTNNLNTWGDHNYHP